MTPLEWAAVLIAAQAFGWALGYLISTLWGNGP
jgi:hypothetical protein